MMKKTLNLLRRFPIVVGFVGIVLVFSFLSDRFFTVSNFMNVLRQVSINGIIAFGMTFVIISGGIDLSVGSIFAFSAVVGASVIKSTSTFLGILAAL